MAWGEIGVGWDAAVRAGEEEQMAKWAKGQRAKLGGTTVAKPTVVARGKRLMSASRV